MNLIIVESPTKAKTISKFLGKEYKLESSFGHIRDLPKKGLGIDIKNDFLPEYEVYDDPKVKKRVAELKRLAQQAESVILAADGDREGEAIAWHLNIALGLDKEKSKRIVFHEITKEAIHEALENPRDIDYRLVNAQQARRILDRLLGYKLSPFLWQKVARGLSAGRVQSVAVRLIVDREREIDAFIPQEYWDLNAYFIKNKETFSSYLLKINNKSIDKFYFKSEQNINLIFSNLEKSSYLVKKIEKKETSKNPAAPFITSTLQQAANNRLGFSAKQTMTIAQKLYELGFITYMRTDSTNLSSKFKNEASDYIKSKWGEKYLNKKRAFYKNKSKNAQEAHEAIRPTSVLVDPQSLSAKLDKSQLKLYQLVWQRALASQMSSAIMDSLIVDIESKVKDDKYLFRSNGQTIKFKGYLEVYPEKVSENDLPSLELEENLNLKKLEKIQHFTQAPARYSDASLVRELEKNGIGRPSTYAPTIETIIKREYVARDEKKRLFPKDIAFVVNDLLVEHFNDVVNYKFTADLENDLDEISSGKKDWVQVVRNFWDPFISNLEKKNMELDKKKLLLEEKSDELCDKCGAPMLVKMGRYGKFLACSSYPECRNIKSLNKEGKAEVEESDEVKKLKEKYQEEKCDKCGAEMIVRNGKFGPFLGCSAYPKCRNIKNIEKEGEEILQINCPVCGQGKIVKKFSRRGPFYACNAYPDCKNAYNGKPSGNTCPQCGSLMIETKKGEKCSNKNCSA